jgi:3-hydroxybutyryl-CoA dehydrogenase
MALVEVVSGLATDSAVAEAVFETARAWGKTPVHVRSTPGFVVNRVARPFYAEALRLLQEGAANPVTLDAALREAGGFRMGPFELMDLIGNDVNYAVTASVWAAFYNDPRFLPSLLQKELVDGGRLGRKSGHGWYDYAAGAARSEPATAPPCPRPRVVAVEGDLGPMAPLADLAIAAGLAVERKPGPGCLIVDGAALALTDGRTATARAVAEERLAVVVDLALDYARAPRLVIAVADQAPEAASAATGFLQALGKAVSVVDDVPGLVVMRTVAMLANEAAEAVQQGVAEPAAIDVAMQKGVNYPLGPLAWAERIGLGRVLAALDNLAAAYGEDRYRASVLLRRKVAAGGRFVG